jgi:hypothetical protein
MGLCVSCGGLRCSHRAEIERLRPRSFPAALAREHGEVLLAGLEGGDFLVGRALEVHPEPYDRHEDTGDARRDDQTTASNARICCTSCICTAVAFSAVALSMC